MTTVHCLGSGGYHPTEDRHTACLMIPDAGIVLDAGTAFFRVRQHIAVPSLDIFLSHVHLDHCVGLTFLIDVLWEQAVERVTVHGKQDHLDTIRGRLFGSPLFPVPFSHELHAMDEAYPCGQWKIRCRDQRHPGGSLGYRLDSPDGSFAYITDTTADPNDADAIDFIRGVDVLVHECYFPDRFGELASKTGHSTTSAVGQVAHAAGVGRLILVHANPLATPEQLRQMEADVQSHFVGACFAEDHSTFDV